jgi:hypothetical protein
MTQPQQHRSPDLTATSFLICEAYNWLGDTTRHRWWRREVGDTDGFNRHSQMMTAIIPLSRDHACFRHVPRDQDGSQPASVETDRELLPYLWSVPQLRILSAGGAVKNGAVVVHYLGEDHEYVAKIYRFEVPGASVPFQGRDFPIFHVLQPDLVRRIAHHYIATCDVPDDTSIGSQLTWVRWCGKAIAFDRS